MPDNRIALAEELERLKNDVFAAPAYSCMVDGARDVLARLVIDNLPTIDAALRADPDAGGAVAMREAAARWHEDQAALYDREATERTLPDGSWAGRDAMWARAEAQDHRSHATAIRALPLASQEGSGC